MVYGRELDGKTVTFGTSGYTMNSVFVLYDRASESLWYPQGDGSLAAVAGPDRGQSIAFLDQPQPMPLAEWRDRHPRTKVLLPPKR